MTFGMDLQDEKTRKGSWTRDEDMLLYSCLARVYIARASEEKMQRESEAASGASSRLSAGKEDIQDAKTSSSEDNRPPIYDCN
ncbi:hypothetical protein MRB53_001525 [Persea americana]|uniref:Uncharacterized protein n=1 Tax=Persea americana TaxID=3435 RepID=A0ACC2MRX2_PERAE|nr:hypothetical protein MRB53_001525 [Persea americana]